MVWSPLAEATCASDAAPLWWAGKWRRAGHAGEAHRETLAAVQ